MNVRLLTAAAAILLAVAPAYLSAQGRGGGYKPPEGPAPKNPWGKPDFNGVWQRPYVPDVTKDGGPSQKGSGPLPYTDWGKQQWETYDAEKGDYTGACLPFGHSRSMGSPDPIQFMQTDKFLSMLYEQNSWFKIIPIAGQTHPKRVPTWFGDSIGTWDGETLVITTTNFNGLTRLDTNGHPHSDQLKMIERMTRTDAGHIDYELTVDDPKTYTRPWTNKRIFTLRTDWEVLEYSCEENNKSLLEGRIKIPNYDEGGKKK